MSRKTSGNTEQLPGRVDVLIQSVLTPTDTQASSFPPSEVLLMPQ
jgi:hypothetical protein